MTGGVLKIEQVYYGSETGSSNYQILAHSQGMTRQELSTIETYSNLGGSALEQKDPCPIQAFYPLGGVSDRWAFANTYFPSEKMGPRGNDYLVKILVIDRRTLLVLRGNVFLLNSLLKPTEKPHRDSQLANLSFNPEALPPQVNGELKLPDLTDAQFRQVKRLLAHFAETRNTCLKMKTIQRGVRLCKMVLNLLPPEDRLTFSFCSHFSYKQNLAFRFALFPEVDWTLVKSYLMTRDTRYLGTFGKILDPDAAHEAAASHWLDRIRKGQEPVYGISLLDNPQKALTTLDLMDKVGDWAKHEYVGSCPYDEEKNETLRNSVLEAGRDLLNRLLPSIQPAGDFYMLESFLEVVKQELANGKEGYLEILRFCERVREIFQSRESPWIPLVIKRLGNAESASHVATGLACLLLVSPHPRLDLLMATNNSPGLFRDEAMAAVGLRALYRENAIAYREILKNWITAWRTSVHEDWAFPTSLWGRLADLLVEKGETVGIDAGRQLARALCAAAPDREHNPEARKRWFLQLIHYFYRHKRTIFPVSLVAQKSQEEQLLHDLEPHEILKPVLEVIVAGNSPPEFIEDLHSPDYFGQKGFRTLKMFLTVLCEELLVRNNAYPEGPELTEENWALIHVILRHATTLAKKDWAKRDDDFIGSIVNVIWFGCIDIQQNLEKCERRDREENKKYLTRFAVMSDAISRLLEIRHRLVEEKAVHIVYMISHSGDDSPELISQVFKYLACTDRANRKNKHLLAAFLERLRVEWLDSKMNSGERRRR